jgi:16S rRNA (uracil1498-N3)-methyltransferase
MDIPNSHRFFVPADAISGVAAEIADEGLAHQLAAVLRLRAGERVLLLDGSGAEYVVALREVGRKRVAGSVEERREGAGEARARVTIYLALLRAERFEYALQKCTELGAAAFVPVAFSRSQPGDKADERKLERWRRIIREAAEQSCRALLPAIGAPVPLAAACERAAAAGPALLLYEGGAPPLRDALAGDEQNPAAPVISRSSALAIMSGPEGGVTPDELELATRAGVQPVSLGPRILRAETAPVAALAATLFALGDL